MAEYSSDGLSTPVVNQEEKKDHDGQFSDVPFQQEGQAESIRERPLSMGENLYSGREGIESHENVEAKQAPPFRVTVTDPEKKGEGMYQYICYKINTEFINASGQKSNCSVVRRFSDFSWLYQQLYANYKGILIPPLPEKAIMGRFSGEFINERKRGLEQFLNRIAAHQDLSQSEDVLLFLHGDDVTLAAARDGKSQTFDSKGFVTFFKDSVNAISNTFSVKEREKSQDDLDCDQITSYAEQLDTSLSSVHNNIEFLLQKDKSLSKNWSEFGVACKLLGRYETVQGEDKLGAIFTQLGDTADKLSVLLTKKVEAENLMFREPIKDYVRIVGSVKAMMKTRNTAQVTYHSSLSTLEGRQAKLNNAQKVVGKEDKSTSLEKSLTEAQASLDRDKEALERITKTCISEAERFKNNKSVDIRKIILDFCNIQIEHSKKVQAAWQAIMPAIEAFP